MQFTVAQIKQMIKEELEVILTNDEAGELFGAQVQQMLEGHGGEGSMAVGQLARLAQMVDEVHGLIDESDDLEEWVEAKITKSHDYINTVLNYLSGADRDFDPLSESVGAMDPTAPDLGRDASRALAKAGIAQEPEEVRKDLMHMILGLDTGNEEDVRALVAMAAYLKDAAAANVRQGLELEEGNNK